MRLAFRAPAADVDTLNPGPLALSAPLLEQLDLANLIDVQLPPAPQLEFSQGQVLALLVAARWFPPRALIRIPDWAHEQAADGLGGLPADKLHDDRRGRALDAFFDQRHAIRAAVTVRALERADLSPQRLHVDTTDVTFDGV